MKKLKPRRYVIIGGTTYYHGDYITASIGSHDEDDDDIVEVDDARICINKTSDTQQGERHFHFWICQDEKDGCTDAEETFGYQYSWTVRVDKDGIIMSTDTEQIDLYKRGELDHIEITEECVSPVEEKNSDEDDDRMPEDWVPSEKDLLFLKG